LNPGAVNPDVERNDREVFPVLIGKGVSTQYQHGRRNQPMIATIQRFNDSTIQRFNDSTIQRFNDSTIQRFNSSTIQRFNSSTL